MAAHRKYAAIDVAKYVSAMLVVAIHTFPFVDISESFNTFFISTLCRLAVPFFFTTSAFFLFRNMSKRKEDARENQARLWHYLKRIGILYLIWTVIYLPYTIYNYAHSGFNVLSLLGWIRDFFLNGSYYHLWFLPALMLGTVIVWALYKRFGLVKTLGVSLVLYIVGYLINIYGPLWSSLNGVDLVYGFFEKTLVTARDGIFFAPIFISLGALIAKTKRPSSKICALGFGISFICLILEVTLYAFIGMLTDLSCMFLCLVPCIYFLMNLLLQSTMPWRPGYAELRQDSTLIYVSHILFAQILLALLPNAHLVVYLATLACAQLLAYVVVKESRRFHWLTYLM